MKVKDVSKHSVKA